MRTIVERTNTEGSRRPSGRCQPDPRMASGNSPQKSLLAQEGPSAQLAALQRLIVQRSAPLPAGAEPVQRKCAACEKEDSVQQQAGPEQVQRIYDLDGDTGFGLDPPRTVRYITTPADYTNPVPGTTETTVKNQNKTTQTVIRANGAVIVITAQQRLSTDTDNGTPSPYQIDERGNTGSGQANVDNLSSGWPRTGPFVGELTHKAPFQDIHSCVKDCKNATPRIPIDQLTQHQADYLEAGGVVLGPPSKKDGVRRPLVENGRIVLSHQLKFADGSSPDPATYNDRVRNSSDSAAFRGQSTITINVERRSVSYGVSGDSQGLYNAEGSPPQVAAAGNSSSGFISVYLNDPNPLISRKGLIQVPRAEFNQARIDTEVGQQYQQWLTAGGEAVIQRARYLAGVTP